MDQARDAPPFDDEPASASAPLLRAFGWVLAALFVIYLFAPGPIVALYYRGLLPTALQRPIGTLYSPITELAQRSRRFGNAFEGYLQLWMPKEPALPPRPTTSTTKPPPARE